MIRWAKRAFLAIMIGAIALPALSYVEYHDGNGNSVNGSILYWMSGGTATQATTSTPLPVGINGALPDTSGGSLATVAANTGTDVTNTTAISSQTQALSVAPGISSVTSLTSSAASTVFPAATRNFLRLTNNNSPGNSNAGCTDDGSTPTATHWDIPVFAGGFYETMRPGFVSNQAIQCIGLTGTVTFVGEAY